MSKQSLARLADSLYFDIVRGVVVAVVTIFVLVLHPPNPCLEPPPTTHTFCPNPTSANCSNFIHNTVAINHTANAAQSAMEFVTLGPAAPLKLFHGLLQLTPSLLGLP